MDGGVSLRLATLADVEPLLELLGAGARFAQSRGIDMWPDRFSDELLAGTSNATSSTSAISRGCWWPP